MTLTHPSDDSELLLIDKLQIFKLHGADRRGRPVLQIIGKSYSARNVTAEAVAKYLEARIYPKLEKKNFSVLYVHTCVDRSENFPGISALKSILEAIPASIKANIAAIYFLHPGLNSRLILATFGRLIFGAELYGKLKYVNRLDLLWDHVRRNGIELPDFVTERDEDLEHERPIMTMDYGLESDHRRVYGGPSMDTSMSMYSMSCIS